MEALPLRRITLVDLSRPMLERAQQRIRAAGALEITVLQADIRDADFAAESFDVAVAAALCTICAAKKNGPASSRRSAAGYGRVDRCGSPTWSSIIRPRSSK